MMNWGQLHPSPLHTWPGIAWDSLTRQMSTRLFGVVEWRPATKSVQFSARTLTDSLDFNIRSRATEEWDELRWAAFSVFRYSRSHQQIMGAEDWEETNVAHLRSVVYMKSHRMLRTALGPNRLTSEANLSTCSRSYKEISHRSLEQMRVYGSHSANLLDRIISIDVSNIN